MSKHIRRLYIVIAIIWGSILGALSFQIIGGGVAGIFWLYVFGDNAWPNWAWIIVHTMAGLAGVLAFSACVFTGWSYSRKVTGKASHTKNDYQRVTILFVLPLIVIFGYVAYDNYQDKKNTLLHQQRVEAEKKREEDSLPYRKTGESDVDYYCRVILKSSKIELFYHGYRIKIVQEILLGNRLLFAIAAPYDLAKEVASEIVAKEEIIKGNKKLLTKFIALPDNVSCGNGMYFISSIENNLPSSLLYMKKVHGEIPSVGVGFTFNVRH